MRRFSHGLDSGGDREVRRQAAAESREAAGDSSAELACLQPHPDDISDTWEDPNAILTVPHGPEAETLEETSPSDDAKHPTADSRDHEGIKGMVAGLTSPEDTSDGADEGWVRRSVAESFKKSLQFAGRKAVELVAHLAAPGLGHVVALGFELYDVATSAASAGSDNPVLEIPVPDPLRHLGVSVEVPLTEEGTFACVVAPDSPSLTSDFGVEEADSSGETQEHEEHSRPESSGNEEAALEKHRPSAARKRQIRAEVRHTAQRTTTPREADTARNLAASVTQDDVAESLIALARRRSPGVDLLVEVDQRRGLAVWKWQSRTQDDRSEPSLRPAPGTTVPGSSPEPDREHELGDDDLPSIAPMDSKPLMPQSWVNALEHMRKEQATNSAAKQAAPAGIPAAATTAPASTGPDDIPTPERASGEPTGIVPAAETTSPDELPSGAYQIRGRPKQNPRPVTPRLSELPWTQPGESRLEEDPDEVPVRPSETAGDRNRDQARPDRRPGTARLGAETAVRIPERPHAAEDGLAAIRADVPSAASADQIRLPIGEPAPTSQGHDQPQSPWQGDKPRPHHYQFAHRALPAIALSPKVNLAAFARSGRLNDVLRATWTLAGERLAEPDRLPDEGLHGELADIGGRQGVLVTLPTAHYPAEAHLVLITPLDPSPTRRYLTLEFSRSLVTGQPATVIGEWHAGRHINHGHGPDADRSAFIERALQVLSQ
jgi:hypothetical protein